MLDSPKSIANDRRIEALLLHRELDEFNSAYAAALDEQRLADWAEMFTDDAFYVVISRENADRNMPVGLIYCENRGMILDRALAMKTEMFAPRYLRHIIGSLDRLLTYAEGRELSPEQTAELAREMEGAMPHVLLREFGKSMGGASQRVRDFIGADLEAERFVGRRRLPTTLGGLLVHVAEHTQRHVGQMVTTVKVVKASRARATSLEPQ